MSPCCVDIVSCPNQQKLMQVSEMIIPDFAKLCRFCMGKAKKLVPIFEEDGRPENFLERLELCTCLKIIMSDGLPRAMCVECLSKIDQFKEFQDQCQQSNIALRQYLSAKEDLDKEENNSSKSSRARKTNNWVERQTQSPTISQQKTSVSIDDEDYKDSHCDPSPDVIFNTITSSSSSTATQLNSLGQEDSQDKSINAMSKLKIVKKTGKFLSSKRVRNKAQKENDSNYIYDNEMDSEDFDDQWPGSLLDEEANHNHVVKIAQTKLPNSSGSSEKHRRKAIKSYECEYCGRSFPRSNHLTQHELTHTKEKPFQCSYCQKSFWYKNSLIGHIKQNHTGDVNFTCEECGRGFFQRSEYNRHKPIHSNETPFKCDECDMSFKLIKNLKRHQKVHTGVRTHTCQYCGKSFRMLQTLRVHLILHTGEKPYKCSHCGKGFSQSAPLKAHVRTHTGERPYVCNFCEEAFPTGNALKAHVFKHTGIHPYSCKNCSLVFKRKRDLSAHHDDVHDGMITEPLQVTPMLPHDGAKTQITLEPQTSHPPQQTPTSSKRQKPTSSSSVPLTSPSRSLFLKQQQPNLQENQPVVIKMESLDHQESFHQISQHTATLIPSHMPPLSTKESSSDPEDIIMTDDLQFV